MRHPSILILTALLFSCFARAASAADAIAEPEAAKPSGPPVPLVAGFVEAAYHANPGQFEADKTVPLRSYDAYGGNNFILHAAHLSVSHEASPALRAAIEIEAGQDAGLTSGLASASGAPELGWFDVQEAFLSYQTAGKFGIIAGKFAADQGIELLAGPKDPTLTRGFLFSFASPFTHVGLKARFSPEGPLDVGVGVVNGWDVMLDNNDSKTVIFRLGVTPSPKYGVALSGTYGAERPQGTGAAGANSDRRLSLDVTGAARPSVNWLLNFQANYGSEPNVPLDIANDPRLTVDANWLGLGLQPVFTKQDLSLGFRWEWFSDPEGVRALAPGAFMNFTLTPGYAITQNFVVRAEFRVDTATRRLLTNHKTTQETLAFGAHYLF